MAVSTEQFSEIKAMVRKHADDISAMKTRHAVTDLQNTQILRRLDNIDDDIKSTKAGIHKLLWLVVAAIIGGLANSIEWGFKGIAG